MRALVFDLSIAKYLLARAVGAKRAPRLFYGPGSCFTLRDVPTPRPPGDDWLVLKPRLAGLCGSDLSAIFFKMSPSMSAVTIGSGESAVFGHEVLADVEHVGPGARDRGIREGDRVVVDPVLGCEARGLSLCARCADGEYGTCARIGSVMPKGVILGACPAWPGGFGETMVAHESQVFRVPDAVADELAVMTEPLAVAVHAVLRHPPIDGEEVLVIGGGPIAFGVLWALREIAPRARVTLFTVEDYQLPIATSLGADRAWSPRGGALLDRSATATSSAVLRPALGREYLSGGFSRVFDCVGSQASLDDSLRITAPGGTIVLVGAAGVTPSLDLTFLWHKELKVEGTAYYADEVWKGRRARTFEATLELLTSTRAPLAALVASFPARGLRTGHRSQRSSVGASEREGGLRPPGMTLGTRAEGAAPQAGGGARLRAMDALLQGTARVTDFDAAWGVARGGPALRAVRIAAEKLRDRFASGPRVIAVRTLPLTTLLYPTKYAFNSSATSPAPFVVMTHRCILVQFLQAGSPKTLLFNPTDIDGARATPYFARLIAQFGERTTKLLVETFEPLETQLAHLGLGAGDIDYIAFDHFHTQDIRPLVGTTDGARTARFPKAVLLAPRCEWDDWDDLHPYQRAWFVRDGKRNAKTERIAFTSVDLALGDGVMLVRTPGHTSGNQTLFLNTEQGVWGVSENGTAADNWSPHDSRIAGLASACRKTELDLVVNANTPEGGATQYTSMILERTLVDRVRRAPAFVQMFPSSEITPSPLAPGLAPTLLHRAITSGDVSATRAPGRRVESTVRA